MSLFKGEPIHHVLTERFATAREAVHDFDLPTLQNPNLAGRIEKLWADCAPEAPTILGDQKHSSEPREERRERNDGFGRRITVATTYIDIWVPFHGDAEMFKVMPSRSRVIDEQLHVQRSDLVYSLPLDDANAEKIEALLADIDGNLQVMRKDVEDFGKSAVQQLMALAVERRTKLAADADKRKKLGF